MPVSFEALSQKGRGRPWKWAAAALAAAALIWAMRGRWSSAGFDWGLLLAATGRIRWGWLAACLVPLAACYLGRALRWAVFLKPLKPRPGIGNLLSATVIGFTAVAIFGRPGEFVRPYLIAAKERVPVASQIGALILERIFDLLMTLLLFGFAFWRITSVQTNLGPGLGWLLKAGGRTAILTCALIVLLLLSIRHSGDLLQRCVTAVTRRLPPRYGEPAGRLFASAIQGVASIRSDAALLLVLLYSLLGWALIVAVYWCVIQSFSAMFRLGIADLLVFVAFVSIGSAIEEDVAAPRRTSSK